MKEMYISKGKVTIVDDEDYEWVSAFSWNFVESSWKGKEKGIGYVSRYFRNGNKRTTIMMHREIMIRLGFDIEGKIVDHENRNSLYNIRSNLRIVNHQISSVNRGIMSTNKSGFRGVRGHYGKYESYININYKCIYLGRFNTALEAAIRYNEEAIKLLGDFAILNDI